jgi:hypothetical protein
MCYEPFQKFGAAVVQAATMKKRALSPPLMTAELLPNSKLPIGDAPTCHTHLT